jgi:hypothetical protein
VKGLHEIVKEVEEILKTQSVAWVPSAQLFCAECPEQSFDFWALGATYEEAEAALRKVVCDWIKQGKAVSRG